MKVVAVSGALGFIGSHVVEALLQRGDYVYAIDAETYAANPKLLDSWQHNVQTGQLKYVKADIVELQHLPDVDAIINLAAETHVDNSILDPTQFIRTNVHGVQNLLELVRAKRQYAMPLFVQISTDEVYGSIGYGATSEITPLHPSSPYAASKAAADLLVQAYGHTFGVPWRIVRPSNCYGERQYPEKLIPKAVKHLGLGRPIPIHEGGQAIRTWLDVKDCARAILNVLDKGTNGEIYNIGGNTEMTVRGVATLAVEAFHGPIPSPADYMDFGYTRLGLDQRYHVDDTKIRSIGWIPEGDLRRDFPSLVSAERAGFRW